MSSRRQSWALPGAWEDQLRDGTWENPQLRDDGGWGMDFASEKLTVPEFEGTGNDEAEVGKSARSYIRKVQVWLTCKRPRVGLC